MYNDIYQTNKHAFRDGFVVGVIAVITAAIVIKKFDKERSEKELFRDDYYNEVNKTQ